MQSTTAIILIVLSCTRLGAASFLDEQSGSPVDKVVKLLVSMKKTLIADEAGEQAVYDKYACWCKKMTEAKAVSIKKAKEQLSAKKAMIEQNNADMVSDYADIEAAVAIIQTNQNDQSAMTNMRRLENIAYTATRAETSQCIDDMYKALTIVKQAIMPAFLDTNKKTSQTMLSTEATTSVLAALKTVPERSLGSLPAAKLAELEEISSALTKGTYTPEKYNRAYKEHFNDLVMILETLQTSVKKDFAELNKAEALAKKTYQTVMSGKADELVLQNALVDKRQAEKTVTASDLAKNTKNHHNQESQMIADIAFFENAYSNCAAKHNEMDLRKKERAEELAGTTKAIEILSGADARALFIKNDQFEKGSSMRHTVSFLQVHKVEFITTIPSVQKQAFMALAAIATQSQSYKLANIAAAVRLTPGENFFNGPAATSMRKNIDNMTADLKTEQTSDDTKKKSCLLEYKTITNKKADLTWDIEKKDAIIGKRNTAIKQENADVTETVNAIQDVDDNIVALDKQREADQDEYVKLTEEDKQAVSLINQAKDVLMAFSNKKTMSNKNTTEKNVALHESFQNGAPTAKLSKAGSRAGQSKGIAGLMTTLTDQYTLDTATRTADNDKEITAHGEQVLAANKLKVLLSEKKTALEGQIANDESSRKAANGFRTQDNTDVDGQNTYKAQIKTDCDFMINNWQMRHDNRLKEADGLAEARRFFEGAAAVR